MSIKRTGGRKPTMGNWRASIWPRANMQYVNVVISMGICIWMHARYTMAGRWHARFGDMCTWFNPSSDPSRPCQSSYAHPTTTHSTTPPYLSYLRTFFFYRPREHCIFIVYRHSSLEICARFHFREGARVQVIYFSPKLSLINADSLYLGSVCNNLVVFRVIELTSHTSKFAHDYSNSFSHSSLQCIRSNNSNCFIYRSKDYQ